MNRRAGVGGRLEIVAERGAEGRFVARRDRDRIHQRRPQVRLIGGEQRRQGLFLRGDGGVRGLRLLQPGARRCLCRLRGRPRLLEGGAVALQPLELGLSRREVVARRRQRAVVGDLRLQAGAL